MSARNPLRIEQRHVSRLHRDGLAHSDDALVDIGSIDRKLDRAGKTYADGCGNDFRASDIRARQQREKHGDHRDTVASIGDDVETGMPHSFASNENRCIVPSVKEAGTSMFRISSNGEASRPRHTDGLQVQTTRLDSVSPSLRYGTAAQSTLMPASLM